MTASECRTWGNRLKKLKAVKHRNALLKLAHGDIYTNERKFRYGLTNSPQCNCGEIDTIEHRFIRCRLTKKIWQTINVGEVEIGNEIKAVIGAQVETTIQDMEIKAEMILCILKGQTNRELWLKKLERLQTSKTGLNKNPIPMHDGVAEGHEPGLAETGPNQGDR